MFNQRPNTLEWRDASQLTGGGGGANAEPLSYWSPTFPSPQDVIKALDDVWRDYYMTHERLAELMPASRHPTSLQAHHQHSPLTGLPSSQLCSLTTPTGLAPALAQIVHGPDPDHQQQQQQQQQPANQEQAQNNKYPPAAQPMTMPSSSPLVQQQQQQQPIANSTPSTTQLTNPQFVAKTTSTCIAGLTAPTVQVTTVLAPQYPQVIKTESLVAQQVERQLSRSTTSTDESLVMDMESPLPGPLVQQQQQHQAVQQPATKRPTRRLTDEERLRHKRERNRRAAANCRRRKDEKLKSLQDENDELRRTIENLKSALASLQQNGNCQQQLQQPMA